MRAFCIINDRIVQVQWRPEPNVSLEQVAAVLSLLTDLATSVPSTRKLGLKSQLKHNHLRDENPSRSAVRSRIIPGVLSAILTLPDYGRVACHPPTIRGILLEVKQHFGFCGDGGSL
jgi:hypothetical protein